MKISNVKVGDKFSTENKLCKALEIEPKTGKGKKYQLMDIRRYLNYQKTGKINPNTNKVSNEIIITEIFAEPKIQTENRGRKGDYAEPMKEFLSAICSGVYTSFEIMELMGICSRDNIRSYENEEKEVKEYKYILKQEFQRKLVGCLNQLMKSDILTYETKYKLKESEYQKFSEWRLSDKRETKQINDIRKKVQTDMETEYSKKFNALKFNDDYFKEYQDRLDDEIYAELGVYAHCRVFDIRNKSNDISNDYLAVVDVDTTSISEAYMKRMQYEIQNKYYVPKSKVKKSFGKRESKQNKKVFFLQTEKVISFHNHIFNDCFCMNNIKIDDNKEKAEEQKPCPFGEPTVTRKTNPFENW